MTLVNPIQSWTVLVCSTCDGELKGRTCVNGHNAYPAKQIEVVAKAELDALIAFTSATIDLLPEPTKAEVVAAMKERVGS